MRFTNTRQWYIISFFMIVIFMSLNTSLVACVSCDIEKQPAYASAVVDGNANEWIPADDFFAPMHRAGRTSKDILSNVYLRYDCDEEILYVMVERATDHKILAQDGDEVYVKIGRTKMVSSDQDGDGGDNTFSWINKQGLYADGWEASFSLECGYYSDLLIHNNVWDGEEQTSSTDKSGLDLCISCPQIDYGDAPNDGGLFQYGSASHKIVAGLIAYMGDNVDGDPIYDGDVMAGTDDNSDGEDDEDGVTFYIKNVNGSWGLIDGSEFFRGRTYKVAVNIKLNNDTAKLAAWFDFFIDGQFGNEPEEIIIDNETIENSSGAPEVLFEQIFTVPEGASKGTTYLRFRLDCQSQDLPPTGLAHVGGEVEDYVTNINSEPPVAVTLTLFSAVETQDGVLVTWNAASEVNHAGYNLYRGESENGPWSKLNEQLIGSEEFYNPTSEQNYEFIDSDGKQQQALYSLEAVNLDGTSDYYGPVQATAATTVEDLETPYNYELAQNYPNPFNPTTTIEFELSVSGNVSIVIYDIQGRAVKTLIDAPQAAGRHTLIWDATNEFGEALPSGLYVYRMQTAEFTSLKRMTLLK